MRQEESLVYQEYVRWYLRTDGGQLQEGIVSDTLKPVLEFIKELSVKLTVRVKDLWALFLNSKVFKIFSQFKWDFSRLTDQAKKAYDVYRKITTLPAELLKKLYADRKSVV